MPVQTGKDNQGCFARWGSQGAKYRFPCGDEKAMGKAKQKAYLQGAAMGDLKSQDFKEAETSNAPWESVDKSKLPKSAFLWIEGDGKTKAQWHLPYKDQSGKINLNALRAISQAIGGARTGKPMNVPPEVRSKISSLLKRYKIGQQADKKSQDLTESIIEEFENDLWILTLAESKSLNKPNFTMIKG